MRGKLILQNHLLPVESVSLARLITDIQSPQRNFHDPFPNSQLDHTTVIQNDVLEVGVKDQTASAGAHFTDLLNLYRSTENAHGTGVSAVASTAYELRQWEVLFKSACVLPGTRRWMEDSIEAGKSIFFIVGFKTFLNPSTAELGRASTSALAEVQLPVSAVAAANVPGVNFSGVFDPSVSGSSSRSIALLRRFDVEREMVYAVQYCKVNFKWFSSKKVEKSSLGPTKWKIHWGVRTAEEVDEDDVVEAELEEEFDEE
jgi:hypothetical protein